MRGRYSTAAKRLPLSWQRALCPCHAADRGRSNAILVQLLSPLLTIHKASTWWRAHAAAGYAMTFWSESLTSADDGGFPRPDHCRLASSCFQARPAVLMGPAVCRQGGEGSTLRMAQYGPLSLTANLLMHCIMCAKGLHQYLIGTYSL